MTDEIRIGSEWAKIEVIDDVNIWEYADEDTEDDSYVSGIFVLEGDTVIDYDGVFDLPVLVRHLLGIHYFLDI